MIVFGFNLPFGKGVTHPDGKEERPPRIIGVGFGWTRDEFLRAEKGGGDEVREGSQREDHSPPDPPDEHTHLSRRGIGIGALAPGDLIKAFTTRLGISPCAACEERAARLNALLSPGRRRDAST